MPTVTTVKGPTASRGRPSVLKASVAAVGLLLLLTACGSADYLVPSSAGSPTARGYEQAAEIHWADEQQDSARAAYDEEQAIQRDPTWAVPYARLAEVLLADNQPAGALAAAESAHRLAPTSELYANNLGQLAIALRRWSLAEAVYGAALTRHPTDWQAAVGLGDVAIHRRQWKQAEADLHDALLWGGPEGIVYAAWGNYYWATLNYAAAAAYYADAQSADPGWWKPYYDLAQVDLKLGQPTAALQNLKSALNLNPAESSVFSQYMALKAQLDPAAGTSGAPHRATS